MSCDRAKGSIREAELKGSLFSGCTSYVAARSFQMLPYVQNKKSVTSHSSITLYSFSLSLQVSRRFAI